MDELLKKFPELIKTLLEKLSQMETNNIDKPEIKAAKEKLYNKLTNITKEIVECQNKEGEKLTEEQAKILEEIPRNISIDWLKKR